MGLNCDCTPPHPHNCDEIINLTIIILLRTPYLACSDFINIFDVDWFISTLAKDVTIVRRVPDKVMRSMEKPPYTMRVPRKSAPEYYLDQVLPILLRRRVTLLYSILINVSYFKFCQYIFLIKLFVSESFLGTTLSVFED